MRPAISTLALLLVAALATGLRFTVPRALVKHSVARSSVGTVLNAGKDLFSDDLFDDEDEGKEKKPIKKDAPQSPTPTRKYLDEEWKLSDEDSKDLKNLPKKDVSGKKQDRIRQPGVKYPIFALMYKFRKEYMEFGAESVLADHKGYSNQFPRLASSQFLTIEKARGAVILFIGDDENDKEGTRAEVMTFIEEDPLVERDIVETWDLIDLCEKGESADLPAAVGES